MVKIAIENVKPAFCLVYLSPGFFLAKGFRFFCKIYVNNLSSITAVINQFSLKKNVWEFIGSPPQEWEKLKKKCGSV